MKLCILIWAAVTYCLLISLTGIGLVLTGPVEMRVTAGAGLTGLASPTRILAHLFNEARRPPMARVGDSHADVLKKLGSPLGEGSQGDRTTLFYPGGIIDLVGGCVVHIQNGFERRHFVRTQAREHEDRMRALGYVHHGGGWTTAGQARHLRNAERARRSREYQFIMAGKRAAARETLERVTPRSKPSTRTRRSFYPRFRSYGPSYCRPAPVYRTYWSPPPEVRKRRNWDRAYRQSAYQHVVQRNRVLAGQPRYAAHRFRPSRHDPRPVRHAHVQRYAYAHSGACR